MKALGRLRESINEPKRAVDVFGALFARPINDAQLLNLATGESLAHLNYLLARDEARIAKVVNGVAWYERVR
jgi:hypothetical protein